MNNRAKSFHVKFNSRNEAEVELTHWAPGYTPGHCSTPIEAVVVAFNANREARALHEARETILKSLMAEHCEQCNYDTHRCGGCGEYLTHGENICASCKEEFKV